MNNEGTKSIDCSWDELIRAWSREGALASGLSEVKTALSTLKRLWPVEVRRLVSLRDRGIAVGASAVELGRLLQVCESVEGFDEVFARRVAGERAAYSELVLVAALQSLGYQPRFASPIGGHVLDAECLVGELPLYFEVVTPEPSDASTSEQRSIDELQQQVKKCISKARVEIEVYGAINANDIQAIASAVPVAAPGVWSIVGSVARVRRIDKGQKLPRLFDGEGAQIFFGGETSIQGETTGVVARWESSDARAKRIFNAEYHQFAESVANVLVVDVCGVCGGMDEWPREMARLLQPHRNRKVGAVAFFEQGILGPPEAIRRRWRLLVNPHSHVAVPPVLLDGLESLDESSWHGLGHPERVIAA